MGHCSKSDACRRVPATLEQLEQSEGLPFEQLLSREMITDMLERLNVQFRDRLYSPYVTLWAFLSQVSDRCGTCQSAVLRVAAFMKARFGKHCSSETTSYCEARQRLPLPLLEGLTRETGQGLDREAPTEWLWHDRRVTIVDGSTASMPDTPDNQAEFPQSTNQKEGLGFPVARIVVLLSLSVGTVLDAAMRGTHGKLTGELSLFREMHASIHPDDIVLGDRLYDSYRDIAEIRQSDADAVFGMKQSRNCDFRQGRKLGKNDHVVTWEKPPFDRSRIDRATWESLPDEMEMRELSVTVRRKGFRSRTITIVTTLLDARQYPADDLADLFRLRWNCELDIRALKTHMGMHEFRCKTPEMVRKEFWAYLLAYNLIRIRMAQAGAIYGVPPREMSFTTAKEAVAIYSDLMLLADDRLQAELVDDMLHHIASHRVGKRPGRVEPRAVKRRKSKHSHLTKPRAQARKELTS